MFQISDFVGDWWTTWEPVLRVGVPALVMISGEVREWVRVKREKGGQSEGEG